ncbi:hypothetical protein JT351_gp33 [Providencia phage vB_PreS-PibeRecoleta]|uniref:Uncharacterized protein n=1 Tax=Providencia phage vB_PreS-PibeRecoleta TaxID=2761109 RepID=A0A7G5B0W6_9CAUD|nr:hypothetical protein JT351_gp33 [Providencia phage vB_PreS-PibeRecoleta]QMV29939.1 hypothetical protein [Providencia phage vB_PreS-PibeRecoleta]
MPVIWFTGFNGASTEILDSEMRLTNADSYASFITKNPNNYVGRQFGSITLNGQRAQQNAPYIRFFGRKYNQAANYGTGYLQGHLSAAPWDSGKRALSIAMVKTSTANFDSFGGFCFQTPVASGGKNYRVGFRFMATAPSVVSGYYDLYFTNIAAAPIDFFRDNIWNNTADFGRPLYYEIEWDNSTRVVTVFKDGVQVAQKTMGADQSLNGGFGIYTELYAAGTATTSGLTNRWFSMSDMYWQTIESEADVALGPGTVVASARPESDDVVQFTRPSAYDSNAQTVSVNTTGTAGGNIVLNWPDRYLTGESEGMQDLYNLNLSNVTSVLASVEAVSVRTVAYNPGTTPMSFGAIAKSGAVQVDPAEPLQVNPNETSYIASNTVLTSDPSDGARWNMAKLANLKVGTKIVS